MPGLSGLFDRQGSGIVATPVNVEAMLQEQMHQPWLRIERWHQKPFATGRVHLDIHRTGPQPVHDRSGRYAFWFDGEIYNHAELVSLYDLDREPRVIKRDAQFVFDLYQERRCWDFLPHLDGIFAMALFDQQAKVVFIASDRLGLRPMYYWLSPKIFAFSAEVKSILTLPGFPRRIERLALEEFIAYGYMLDDRTWFEDVRLLEPATILKVTQSESLQIQYWSWNDIKPLPSTVSVEEAAEEMGRLWQQVVENRVASDHTYSLTLSGGRDSRAILATLPENRLPIPCLTFGRAGCSEIRFAAQAANVRQCPHYVAHLDGKGDWLSQQEWVVWLTDGLATMLSLLGRYMSPKLREFSEILLNAYIGDVVAGGSYGANSEPSATNFGKKFSYPRVVTPTGFNAVEHVMQVWRDSGLALEMFMMYQRARRYILVGSVQHTTHLEQRKPFVSKDFLSFTMSMPEIYRHNGVVYERMLLTRYPELFEQIPWEATGIPISASKARQEISRLSHGLLRRIGSRLPGTLKFTPKHAALAYDMWLRQEPAQSFIRHKLLAGNRHIYQYVPKEKVAEICQAHFSGRIKAYRMIGRLLTIEMYFQFVFENHRPSLPDMPVFIGPD